MQGGVWLASCRMKRVWGFGLRVYGLGFRVSGLGFRGLSEMSALSLAFVLITCPLTRKL